MRLSIWQQFSSNHSASFTVLGVFDTPALAKQAETELQHMITTIENWHLGKPDRYPLAARGKKTQQRQDLTPPEYHFAEHYQIEWPQPVEWITHHDPGDLTLKLADNVVSLSSFNYAFQGPRPFDVLMAKMGGKVTLSTHSCVDYEDTDTHIVLNVTCTTADAEKAEWIDLVFQDYRDMMVTDHAFYGWIDKETEEYWPAGIRYNQTERSGTQLAFKNMAVSDVGFLPDFIQYLKREGCNNVEFEFQHLKSGH
jgi:hypothetical protein